MKILVTGSGGMVGSFISEYLSFQGHYVCGIVRNGHAHTRIREIACDLSRPFDLNETFDLIVHTSGILPYRKPTVEQYKRDNIDSMENLLNYAKKRGISKIINLSTIGVYGEFRDERIDEESDKINPDCYGLSKLLAEKMLMEDSEVEGISLRMPGILGNGARGIWITDIIEKMKKNELVSIYSPDFVTTNFVSTKCLAVFIQKLIEMEKWKYDTVVLAASKGNTVLEIVNKVKDKLGSQSEIKTVLENRTPFYLDAARALEMGYPESTPIDIIVSYLEDEK